MRWWGFLLLYVFASQIRAEECSQFCGKGPRAEKITVRHIEPGGIGYKQGYSSLDFFLTIPNLKGCFLPFLDLRGHVFNDAKGAANVGVAFRYLSPVQWIFGLNTYYDYRKSSHKHYNQVSGGLEVLGKYVDFRINGYFPVGWKRTLPFDFFFQAFPDDSFILNVKREFAMTTMDAEAGGYLSTWESIKTYLAVGPYYLHTNKFGDCTWGGKVRLALSVYTYLALEGNVSYDSVFHWIGQGSLAINIPFGCRRAVYSKKECNKALILEKRMFGPVGHNEIIVLDTKRGPL